MPTTHPASPSASGPLAVLATLLETAQRWWHRDSLRRQFSHLPPGEGDRILLDLGLAPSDLPVLLAEGRRQATLLPRVAARFGQDAATMNRDGQPAWRDLQRGCLNCTSARRCRRALRRPGVAAFLAFCPNASVLGDLQADCAGIAPTEREAPVNRDGKPKGRTRSLWEACLSEPFVGTD